jgi:hypothetical protein
MINVLASQPDSCRLRLVPPPNNASERRWRFDHYAPIVFATPSR